jgi:Dickkopf N-terminal cysteine-rich region
MRNPVSRLNIGDFGSPLASWAPTSYALTSRLFMPKRVSFVLLALASFLSAAPAFAAAPKDAQLEKAITTAMDVEYLETSFDKAEKRLRNAIETCGADKCTPALKAKGLMALGIVLAGGKKQLDDAREVFVEALTIDKDAKPADELRSSEVNFAYAEARKQMKLDGGSAPSGASVPGGQGLSHTSPTEQRTNTPLPLYIELVPELLEDAKKATVTYLAPGAADWKTLLLKRVGEQGFGLNVPCSDMKTEGDFKYHLTVTDADGAIITAVGSRTQPLVTKIKPKIEGNPPSWPGFAPPDVCVDIEAGPRQCLDDNQCNSGLVCMNGECKQKPEEVSTEPKGPKRNYVSLVFSPDISIFAGENVCSFNGQQDQHFVCVRENGTRYVGVPTTNIANNVNPGLAPGTMRVIAGYDRLILDNIMAGVRVGFAFPTASADAAQFLPIHAEARGAFYLGKKPFERTGPRPFVFLAGGLAQVDSGVTVEVLEDGAACGATTPANPESPCTIVTDGNQTTPEKRVQKLTAIKQAGQGFVALGGGLQYAVNDMFAINAGLRLGLSIPVMTFVLSPEVGATIGF